MIRGVFCFLGFAAASAGLLVVACSDSDTAAPDVADSAVEAAAATDAGTSPVSVPQSGANTVVGDAGFSVLFGGLQTKALADGGVDLGTFEVVLSSEVESAADCESANISSGRTAVYIVMGTAGGPALTPGTYAVPFVGDQSAPPADIYFFRAGVDATTGSDPTTGQLTLTSFDGMRAVGSFTATFDTTVSGTFDVSSCR